MGKQSNASVIVSDLRINNVDSEEAAFSPRISEAPNIAPEEKRHKSCQVVIAFQPAKYEMCNCTNGTSLEDE